MNRKHFIVSTILASLLLTSACAFAEWPKQGWYFGKPGKEKMRQHFMPAGPAFVHAEMALKLQLTVGQRADIRNIHLAANELEQPIIEKIVLNRKQIKDIVKVAPYDESEIKDLATIQGDLISRLVVIKASSKAAVLAVLTDEQKQLLEREKQADSEK